MMHICHNTMVVLQRSLRHFDSMVYRRKNIAKLLRPKESKDRVLATCLSSGAGAGFAGEIKSFKAQVYHERWHTIADCVKCILEIEVGLRHCWSLSKYMSGTDKHAKLEMLKDSDDEHNAKLTLVEDAIQSDVFWTYMRMLSYIGWLQTQVIRWVNSCPCHWTSSSTTSPCTLRRCSLLARCAADGVKTWSRESSSILSRVFASSGLHAGSQRCHLA